MLAPDSLITISTFMKESSVIWDGNTPADFQSATSGYRPEIATVAPLKDGANHYTIKIVPFQPTGETVNVKIELLPGASGCGTPGFGSRR